MHLHLFLGTCLAGFLFGSDELEQARYLRPAGKDFALECEFKLSKTKTGSSIESTTERGNGKLEVSARYDTAELLTEATVVWKRQDKKSAATVRVAAGKATVTREGQPPQEFDVPQGVIVTSAPDWTDTFLLCRRYDRKKAGKQSFPGLWIHPEQPAQRLNFAIERTGADTIEHSDKKVELDRYTIWLRGNSRYAAWADDSGAMIKLIPLPYKDGAANWLVRSGYEKTAPGLRP